MAQRGIPQERLNLLWIAFYACVAVLGCRLLYIQVIRNVYYTQVAESNRTQIIPQNAPRGRIYDRNGEVIATNRPAFSLIYLPGEERDPESLDTLAGSLAKELHQEKGEVLERLQEAQREESAVHLAENLPLKAMFKLSELKTIYPGVDLIVEARRYYPRKSFAGHLLGYMGRMDKRELRRLRGKGYRLDSWVGKSGVEQIFEAELRGVDGEIRMEVDAHGRLKRKLDQVPWRPGGNVHLTLDAGIQAAMEEAMRASPSGIGGAVALDPRDGRVLAMTSVPGFDPNLFLLPDWDTDKEALKDFPAFNRAVSGTYAPGSIFKIVVGAALFEEGGVDPGDRIFCPGSYTLGNRTFRCWEKKGHGRQSWIGALTHSCDVYFYQMSLKVGAHLIEKYEKAFHLGRLTRVGLSAEKSGNLFGPEARRSQGRGWYDGETLNLSIGQGELLATPIQMAVLTAAVANRGTLYRPYFAQKVENSAGQEIYRHQPEEMGKVRLSSRTWDLIDEGLRSVVENGTGRRVHIPGLVVRGKTGTTQNAHGDDHAWFTAYASRPGEEPSIAVSVLVEHGLHGSSGAGPVARRVLEAAFGISPTRRAIAGAPEGLPDAPALERPLFPSAPAGRIGR